MCIASGPDMRRVWIYVMAMAMATACSDPGDELDGADAGLPPGTASCERDENGRAEDAAPLTLGEVQTGYICPIGDIDWYSFDVPATDRVLNITLRMATPVSPVELTYAVHKREGQGASAVAVARPESTSIGAELKFSDCVDPGPYLIAVRDFHGNVQDPRQSYQLLVSTSVDTDTHEPNDSPDEAVALSDGVPVQGTIACRGDEDWFSIEVPQGRLLRVRLDSAPADYQPTVTVYDGDSNLVFRQANLSGPVQATEIDRLVILPGAGRYYLVVTDESKVRTDTSVPYTLTADLVEDIDPNEPNNSVADATPLTANPVPCGAGWTTFENWGTIAAPGDNDWFRIPLEGCENGLFEAEMEFVTTSMSNEEKWALSTELQASLTMVRPHPESSCEADADCALLDQNCSGDLDCAGIFESCHPQQRRCIGAGVCLPGGTCGANQVQRRYECSPLLTECRASADRRPRKNKAVISAPLSGAEVIYLRASDFSNQAAFPTLRYNLRVRVRQDPDVTEPKNIFTNQVQADLPIRQHQEFALEVPVYDCTGAEPECCGSGTWTTGRISYENDMDWYRYAHPCPGEDCTLRFHWRYDAGPVDMVMNIYRGTSLWFTPYNITQRATQPAASGTLGGLTPDAQCFYAFNRHTNDYFVQVRDLFELLSDGRTINPLSRDWDPEQTYSFCVEKVSNQCEEPPCMIYENGCGRPR